MRGGKLLPIDADSDLGEQYAFFYSTRRKVTLIVFAMGFVRSFFSPEKTRALLAGKREGVGNVLAATLGIVTPFCSCSAVPLFIGFVSAGVPLGVTFSFLISAPMVNEVALGLLFGLVGWKVAVTYLGFGLGVAIVAGWVIGRLHLEHWIEEWVLNVRAGWVDLPTERLSAVDRIKAGVNAMREIVGKVWPWIAAGIAVGALIHGYVPANFPASIMGKGAWWSVSAAVVIGIPMYSNAAGIIPVAEALLAKGAAAVTLTKPCHRPSDARIRCPTDSFQSSHSTPLQTRKDLYRVGSHVRWQLSPVKQALDRAGWQTSDIQRMEINEAFAAIAIAVTKDLGINADVVNVEGGAIAHGHPIGASGAVLKTRLLHSMHRDAVKKGIVTLCIGGGQGIALALDAVE